MSNRNYLSCAITRPLRDERWAKRFVKLRRDGKWHIRRHGAALFWHVRTLRKIDAMFRFMGRMR